MTQPHIPPARVIALWNGVAEDTGTLDETLVKFADLLLAEAERARISRQDAPGRDFSGGVVSQHPRPLAGRSAHADGPGTDSAAASFG